MMDIAVPAWILHGTSDERRAIYSCHVSPTGAHLATGGGGECPCPRARASVTRVRDDATPPPPHAATCRCAGHSTAGRGGGRL
jgi:hypothetical protein